MDFGSLLMDNCKIEECYASKKGGGLQFARGNMTVLGSHFFNNSAGSENLEDGKVSLKRLKRAALSLSL